MALAQIYSAQSGDTITSARWNNEFGNIYTNGTDVSFPVTKAVSFAGWTVTYDLAGVSTVTSPSNTGFLFTVGNKSGTPSASGSLGSFTASTFTDSNTAAAGTASLWTGLSIRTPTLAASAANVTTTEASTVYIEGPPTAGTNETITNPYALHVVGNVKITGMINCPSNWSTGDVKLSFKTAADTGWILMNDGTFGDASSGGTTRANADTVNLFTLLWTNLTNQWAPVSSGRGASAAADYAAHKTMTLPRALGRALAGYGIGTSVETCTASSGNGFTVDTNNSKWITGMTVIWSALSGFTTSGSAGPTYYVVRISSTNVRFATTLTLAQNGAPDITISGSGSVTLTHTYATRELGEYGGEGSHAQSLTELLAHTHTSGTNNPTSGGGQTNRGTDSGGSLTASTGGNVAASILQATLFLNVMIKL